MKKINVTGYDFARNYQEKFSNPDLVEVIDAPKEKSSIDNILELVYAPDERTGLPTGDLNYLVNDKANPEVKEFIKSQLLMDTSAAANVVAKFNMSDDDVLALSINKGETLEDYAARLNNSIDRDKWIIQQSKNVPAEPKSTSVSAE